MRETTRRRQAFEAYFRLGAQRSIERLRDGLLAAHGRAPALRTLYRWSGELGWQRRIDELEREAAEADRETFVAERREASRRHIQASLLLQQKGVDWLQRIDAEHVSAQAAVRAVVQGIALEREARGMDEIDPGEPERVVHELRLHLGGPQEAYVGPIDEEPPRRRR